MCRCWSFTATATPRCPIASAASSTQAAPGPKSFWTVKGADHNDLVETAGPEFRERLRRFYASLPLPASPAALQP